MNITTSEGTFYSGTPAQIVGLLWKHAFMSETTVDKYMRAVHGRVAALGSEPPRTDSAQHFLEDLGTAGIITITAGGTE